MLEYDEGTRKNNQINATMWEEMWGIVSGKEKDVPELIPLGHGAVNETYKFFYQGVALVARRCINSSSAFDVEKQVIRLVRSTVSVPELIIAEKNSPWGIFRFVEGQHLFELHDPTLAPTLSLALGATLAAIHQFCHIGTAAMVAATS